MMMPDDASPEARPAHPGDVGRRVEQRRRQLGLTREETAARAGMAVNYLEYVESSPTTMEMETLTRLADALRTTVSHLLGGGLDVPPGQAGGAAHPVLAELGPEECWARLSTGGVGRVVLSTPDGPMAVPVNFRVLDRAMVYRTAPGSLPARAAGGRVAFEVDRIDEAFSQGWSVLALGRAEHVTDPADVQRLNDQADPHPWAGGERDMWVRIRPSSITGRAIRTPEFTPTDLTGGAP